MRSFYSFAATVVAALGLGLPAAFGLPSPSIEIDIAQASGVVEFKAIGRPSALKILGRGAKPKGRLIIKDSMSISGTLEVDLSEFSTGISLRDRHMKEKYLEVSKYPKAILTIDKLELPPDFLTSKQDKTLNQSFSGNLLLHGVERPVTVAAQIGKTDGGHIQIKQVQVKAEFELNIEDFAIGIPGYAGITVTKSVQVSVDIPDLKVQLQQ